MEIKDLIKKFYPNADVSVMELCPYYDSAKSFYGKAKVIEIENDVFLMSYDTIVAYYNRGAKIAQVFDTYSATTLRHIKEFLKQSGFKAESKKQIEKDYCIENLEEKYV
jgi:hypothetical protein